MTIKWKITVSLVCVSLLLVASYVYTAQRVFEDDKISYIYENQQSQINDITKNFNNLIEQAASKAQIYLKEFKTQGALPSDVKKSFEEQKEIFGVYYFNFQNLEIQKIANKQDGPQFDLPILLQKVNVKKLDVSHIGDDLYLVNIPSKNATSTLLIIVEFISGVESTDIMQLFIADGTQIIKNLGAQYIDNDQATSVLSKPQSHQENLAARTSKVNLASGSYLTTSSHAKFGDLKFVSLMDEHEALKALDELLKKSILYVIISTLITFIVALLLSHKITYRMRKLTLVAEEIGKGDFDAPIDFESNDEVGVLASAFKKMGQEIKQLFSQKIEKDRMERELQTAAVIQERLFPEKNTQQFGEYLLSGYYETSTECGGDWWYYYQSGFELYLMIADTTGHGIPAALITSASNAIFSHIKNEVFELDKIVQLWDEAVYQSSKGKFFMTAQLVRLNLATGDCEIVNLGHELPIQFKSDTTSSKFLVVPKNFSLGERSQSPAEVYNFSLEHGDQLLLYSDGVLAMMSDDVNSYSDKQFLKRMNTFFSNDTYGEGTAQEIFQYLKEHSKRTLQGHEDDITIVRLSRGS